MIYACTEGVDFVNYVQAEDNIVQFLKSKLDSNQGKVELSSSFLELSEEQGIFVPMGAGHEIVLYARLPNPQGPFDQQAAF